MKEKHPCHTMLCAFRCLILIPQILNLRSQKKFMENYFFLKKYVTLEGAVSHNVLYYQPLPIMRQQVRFDANKYFESNSRQIRFAFAFAVSMNRA